MTQVPPPSGPQPPQPTQSPAEQPAESAAATNSAAPAKPRKSKRVVIVAASVIAAVALAIAAFVVVPLVTGSDDKPADQAEQAEQAAPLEQVEGTPEEFAETKAQIEAIETAFEPAQAAYLDLNFTATTELVDGDIADLLAYDRAAEVVAASATHAAADAKLAEAFDALYASHALQNDEGRKLLSDLKERADDYLSASVAMRESAPAIADVITGCLQPNANVRDIFEDGAAAAPEPYDPNTALARYDANSDVARCRVALDANPGPLSYPPYQSILETTAKKQDDTRATIVDSVAIELSQGIDAAIALEQEQHDVTEQELNNMIDQATTELAEYQKKRDFPTPMYILDDYVDTKL